MEDEDTASVDLYLYITIVNRRSLADAEILRFQQTSKLHAVQVAAEFGARREQRTAFMDVEARKEVYTLVCCATSRYVLGS